MYKGTVKSFNDLSGWGVIVRENGEDIPVHVSAIRSTDLKTLKKGETVLFDIGRGRSGFEAVYAMVPARKCTVSDDEFIGLQAVV